MDVVSGDGDVGAPAGTELQGLRVLHLEHAASADRHHLLAEDDTDRIITVRFLLLLVPSPKAAQLGVSSPRFRLVTCGVAH